MKYIVIPVVGFANGIIVGGGVIALITLLDIVPRLAQITQTYDYIKLYESIIVIGATVAAFTSLTGIGINLGIIGVVIVGFTMGIFVGLLASALAEVLNVLPIIVRRFKIDGYLVFMIYSLIFGKVLGAFLNWFYDF
jgi:stage V sporulation protein AB